jgi:hypothetical protein
MCHRLPRPHPRRSCGVSLLLCSHEYCYHTLVRMVRNNIITPGCFVVVGYQDLMKNLLVADPLCRVGAGEDDDSALSFSALEVLPLSLSTCVFAVHLHRIPHVMHYKPALFVTSCVGVLC